MSRKLIPVISLALAAALAGCSSTAITSAVNGINSVTGALSSSSATQAIANLKAGSSALVCDVASVSSLASTIEAQGLGSQVLIKDTTDVYVVSADVCAALGGSVVPGPVVVPASATPVVAQ